MPRDKEKMEGGRRKLLDQTWKLLVQVIGGISCVSTGQNDFSFARRG